jgi:hypothetical protein
VRGAGFGPQEIVQLTDNFHLFDGNTLLVSRNVQSDGAGRLGELFIQVPRNAKNGVNELDAAGQTSKRKAGAHLYVVYRPTLQAVAGSVRPGAAVTVIGQDYVPNSPVTVSVTIPRTGDTNETLSKNVNVGSDGTLSASLTMPNNVRLGRYFITAVDSIGGFRASTSFTVSIHPVLLLRPNFALPGQAVLVYGSSFSSGIHVTITAAFTVSGGGQQNVSSGADTNSDGAFVGQIAIPRNAIAGTATVRASESHGQATTRLIVQQPKPLPTSTPAPTQTPLPQPTPTATSQPTSHHTASPSFSYISIWYHTVRVGTYDHIILQANLKTTLGIWVIVYFPSGQRLAYYQNTDSHGRWEKQFPVPSTALNGAKTTDIFVTFQLWKGHRTQKTFRKIALVR